MTPAFSGRQAHFFSQEKFIDAIVRAEGGMGVRVLKVQSPKSPAHMFGLERLHKFNIRSVSLAPYAMPAYPADYDNSRDNAAELIRSLQTTRTLSFDWNVRFDHQDLAKQLAECGLKSAEWTTHVLFLDRDYDALFRDFSPSTRNQIRRAEREGVVVRRGTQPSDVAAYYNIYEKISRERKWGFVYSCRFLEEMLRLEDNVVLLMAELEQKIIGGGWYIRDGNSLFYWQSAIDYEYKRWFPMYAIINRAIRLACMESMESFNMGGGDMPSLEQFKSFWGARKLPMWGFVWKNPILSAARQVWTPMRQILERVR